MSDRPLGIIELLTRVGEERVTLQSLNDAFHQARRRKDGVTVVSFGSMMITPNDLIAEPADIFLVIRLPRADVERAKKEHQAKAKGSA